MNDLILYNCVHKKLNMKVNCTRMMRKKDFYKILRLNYRIPNKLIPPIIKELEILKIIENVNRNYIKIKPYKKDFEEQANKLYIKLGVF